LARRRFFVDAIRGGMAELSGDDARHLTRVLRAEPGQRYEITDGQAAYLAEVAEARGQRVVFRAIEPIRSAAPAVRIALCAALVKFDRFEWTIEKATELGVETILPVEAARSEKGLLEASRKRAARWERIARESSQQARRVAAPRILEAVPFERALAQPAGHRYFLEETAAPPLLQVLPADKAAGASVALLVGPEGGWTAAERAQAAPAGWQAAGLGPLVLRAETAAIAALAVIGNAWMP
jgi:16S rRNA (uracil1498-N3)-methyltransferase